MSVEWQLESLLECREQENFESANKQRATPLWILRLPLPLGEGKKSKARRLPLHSKGSLTS